MKSKFVFSNPNINRLVLNGYHYTEEDTLDAFNDIYLSGTETLCRRNNLTIDGIYVINLEKHECGDSSKLIDLLNDFVMERITLEKYGDNSIMIFLVCDYTCPIYKYIHKVGFVKMADCDNDNVAVYIGSTPFTNFIYDITRTEKDLSRTNKSDKPLFS